MLMIFTNKPVLLHWPESFYDNSKRHDTRAMVLGVAGGAAILFSVHLFSKRR